MGAFGSCLGVGRPIRPGANPRLLASNSINVDSNASRSGPGPIRPNSYARDVAPINVRSPNGLRQAGLLANSHQQHLPFAHHPPQVVPNLLELDDQPISDTAKENAIKFDQELRSNPDNYRVFIAKHDFATTQNRDDLAFYKGELLETSINFMNSHWWLARSKSTKMIGYVPSNYVDELKTHVGAPWYFNDIRRVDAETLLRNPENKDGSFIIRISQTGGPDQFSLSLKHDNAIKHYKIVPHESGGFYINKKKGFLTLHDLVQHYSNAPDGLCINLCEPCKTRLNQPASLAYDPRDPWEIDRSRIKLLGEIGRGQFGQVYEGLLLLNDGERRVAIKTLRKDSMSQQDFLAEAQIMKKMQHSHLVRLFAVSTKLEPVYIVTELMSKGALIDYLKSEEGRNLTLQAYIGMATQIADGMSFLEREKFVHRDLAARNILVGDNHICKIADFGLARFIRESEYEAQAGARFPIKWTAPEAANHSKFTIKSDVWSFGIVLYEIITKGGTPYPDMTNAEVLETIGKGYRMPKPNGCEPKYYGIMLECWQKDSNKRPTFCTLHWKLDNYFISDEQYKEASQFRELP